MPLTILNTAAVPSRPLIVYMTSACRGPQLGHLVKYRMCMGEHSESVNADFSPDALSAVLLGCHLVSAGEARGVMHSYSTVFQRAVHGEFAHALLDSPLCELPRSSQISDLRSTHTCECLRAPVHSPLRV